MHAPEIELNKNQHSFRTGLPAPLIHSQIFNSLNFVIMARLRVLELAKPFVAAMPEVQVPYQKVDVQERAMWLVAAGILYSVLSELPLYGAVRPLTAPDAWGWLRPLLAASNGSALELGVVPIVLSGFVLQILASRRYLTVSLDLRSDRTLFQSAQKLLAMFLSFSLSILLSFSGKFGSPAELGYKNFAFILFQLWTGGLFMILADEIFSKGYGLGTGVMAFTTLSSAQRFVWWAVSLVGVETESGNQFFGALPNLTHNLYSRSVKYSLIDGVFRSSLPNLVDIMTALLAFIVIVYVSMFRYEILLRSTKMRGASTTFPVRLLYVGCTPILFWASLLAVLRLVSSSLYLLAPGNPAVKLLGTWAIEENAMVATSGLVSFLQPPNNSFSVTDSVRAVVYLAFTLSVITIFSRLWAEASGSAPSDIAKQLKDNDMVIVGRRDTGAIKELRKTIPLAATTGGVVLGLYLALFDILGATGWSACVAMGVMNISSFLELMAQEGFNPAALQGN